MSSSSGPLRAEPSHAELSRGEPSHDCPLCPRLVAFRNQNRAAFPNWFNGPVPSLEPTGGKKNVRLLIVGLAPGLKGANRTGRPFTGDAAGELLYPALLKAGLATGVYEARPDDTLKLKNCMISNAVRCVPPQNKPIGAEEANCRVFLKATIESLPALSVILALGTVAHNNVIKVLGGRLSACRFAHGKVHKIAGYHLIDSYHCSRYNLNTGVLTPAMFNAVIGQASRLLNKA